MAAPTALAETKELERLMEARRRLETLNLTPKQSELLQYFLDNVDRLCSNDEISDKVWGADAACDSTIAIFIYNLRKKLPDGYNIVNSFGLGYKLTIKDYDPPKKNIFLVGEDLLLDMDNRELHKKDGQKVNLTKMEYLAFEKLVKKKGYIVRCSELADLFGTPESIRTTICNLRGKLGEDDIRNPKYILNRRLNRRGIGYKLIAQISYLPQEIKA